MSLAIIANKNQRIYHLSPTSALGVLLLCGGTLGLLLAGLGEALRLAALLSPWLIASGLQVGKILLLLFLAYRMVLLVLRGWVFAYGLLSATTWFREAKKTALLTGRQTLYDLGHLLLQLLARLRTLALGLVGLVLGFCGLSFVIDLAQSRQRRTGAAARASKREQAGTHAQGPSVEQRLRTTSALVGQHTYTYSHEGTLWFVAAMTISSAQITLDLERGKARQRVTIALTDEQASSQLALSIEFQLTSWPSRREAAQHHQTLALGSLDVPRLRYGQEYGNTPDPTSLPRIPCSDCGVAPGELHVPGCRHEHCPLCHTQLRSCDHAEQLFT